MGNMWFTYILHSVVTSWTDIGKIEVKEGLLTSTTELNFYESGITSEKEHHKVGS